MNFDRLVPDDLIIIEGFLSKNILSKKISFSEIFISESLLRLFELDAEKGKASGFLALEELKKLQELSSSGFEIIFSSRKFLKNSFFMDDLKSDLVSLAWEKDAVLLTGSDILMKLSKARGVKVFFVEKSFSSKKLVLESFFDDSTMSVHLREGIFPVAKKGSPASWSFVKVGDKKLSAEDIKVISTEIIESAHLMKDAFIEIERDGSTIVQLGLFRIVILRPPLTDGWEITAVRQVKQLNIDDYALSEKLLQRIEKQAEGILISGAPGQGKSTFAQALAVFYSKKGKIVKTVEAPRDLVLPDDITQLSISRGTAEEIHDILLLSRPDYTIFDEMRNTKDFLLYSDLRLAGVGLVGVVHGTNPIDSIQRFIGRIELGVIPHILDTVIFINGGKVFSVLSVEMRVKVPAGMTEADLARPVVVVSDFETGKLFAEIYSYGEETVVIPVEEAESKSPVLYLAEKQIEKEFEMFSDIVKVEAVNDNRFLVRVPEKYISSIIGKEGKTISKIEKSLGVRIDVKSLDVFDEKPAGKKVNFKINESSNSVVFDLGGIIRGDVDIYVDENFVATFAVGKSGLVKIKKKSGIGRLILSAVRSEEKIELMVR
jgi:ATPase